MRKSEECEEFLKFDASNGFISFPVLLIFRSVMERKIIFVEISFVRWYLLVFTIVGSVSLSAQSNSVESILKSEPYWEMRGGLDHAYWKFEKEEKVRVAFLGGSITHNSGWRDSVMQYLERRFPLTAFEFISAGIPSMGTTPAAFRLERDVLADGPIDLLFEEAAVNDATNGRSIEEQIRGMEGIVRHVLYADPTTDIVIMHFVDPDKMEDYRKGRLPTVIENHEKVADLYNIPTIHLAREVTDRIDAGEFTWEKDFIDLHPSPFGQGVYARSIIGFLDKAWRIAEEGRQPKPREELPPALDPHSYDAGLLVEVEPEMEKTGWDYVNSWSPEDGAGTRQNYTEVPMLIGGAPGKTLSFNFRGRAVGIAVAAGSDAGVIRYRIDGGSWQKQNLFTRWSARLHLPWYYTLASGLEEDEHQLEIELSSEHHPESTGTVCRIRYFYVNR